MKAGKFREKRKALGYTQSELASLLGLSLSAIQKMESGSRPIMMRTVLALKNVKPNPTNHV